MTKPILIRDAVPEDAMYLSDLAVRSKAHWGYSSEFMKACIEELSASPEEIASCEFHYVVATTLDNIIGFYALEDQSGTKIELGALFVEPKYIGRGVGKALMNHAKSHALALGARSLIIQGDPHAEKFYRAAGGEQIGTRESESIPGRFLPTFNISLVDKNVA